MRILLDESVLGRLGSLLTDPTAITVRPRGWASIKNGKLLALAAGKFDVLLTADKGMEHQQNSATLPVAILIVLARSNRFKVHNTLQGRFSEAEGQFAQSHWYGSYCAKINSAVGELVEFDDLLNEAARKHRFRVCYPAHMHESHDAAPSR